MEAFIKLQRKLLEWEWYGDMVTKTVFIHLLLKANWKDGRWKGVEVKRGSLITGRRVLADELNLSEQQIRTALTHLKSTNEITIKTTTKYSVITIVNYDKYQQINQQNDQVATNNQPSGNQQLTTIEEYKNNKNKKNNKNVFVKPSLEEIREYIREKNYNVDADRFMNYYESNGWKVGRNPMKDWKAAVRNWASKEKKPESSDNLLDDIERIYLKGGVK